MSETRTGFAHLTGSRLEHFTALNSNIESDPDNLIAKVGILVIVRDDLSSRVKIEKGCSKQVVWVSMIDKEGETTLVCGAVYLASESASYHSFDMFDDIVSDITNFKAKYSNAQMCLMGDFNARTGVEPDWFNEEEAWFEEHLGLEEIVEETEIEQNLVRRGRENEDKVTNRNGQRLLNVCRENNLAIVNGRVKGDQRGAITCFNRNGGKSAVDYAIVSHGLLPQVEEFQVAEYNPMLSDAHCPIMLTLKLGQGNNDEVEAEGEKAAQWKFKWSSDIQEAYTNEFEDVDLAQWKRELESLKENPSQAGVDAICESMRGTLMSNAERAGAAIPPQERRRKLKAFKPQNSWFDTECARARTHFHRIRQRVSRLPDTEKRMQTIAAAREYRSVIRQKKLEAERQLRKKMQNLRSDNSKEYWRILKSAGKQNRREIRSDDADAFRDHFKRLSGLGQDNPEGPNIEGAHENAFNRRFTVEELRKITLPNGKACGMDKIQNEYIRNCPDSFMEIITEFFNIILDTGLIPDEWCMAIIVPIFKKGDVRNPDNYRGISLLSCMCKLFTTALNVRLTAYADEEGLIGEEQAGFRSGYSTADHIFTLHAIIELYKAASKRLYCAFVDYKKAFDMVDRTALWAKLLDLGVDGKLMRVIVNLYQKAKAVVRVCGRLTDSFPCNIGVRQGESLSPLLFALFLRDLNGYIATRYEGIPSLADQLLEIAQDDDELELYISLFILLYADDTIIMAESADELQRALNALHEYCSEFKLEVNLVKTKVVIFAARRVDDYPAFLFGHGLVKVVDEYVYLGVTFHRTGNFKYTIQRQISQANRAMNSLMWRSSNLNLPNDAILDLYSKTVIPVVTYGSEVWGHADLEAAEIFHRKCLKRILGVGDATTSNLVYGETGMAPLTVLIGQKMVSFWLKIIHGKQTKIVKLLYHLLKKKHYATDFVSDWIYDLHGRLEEAGLEEVWVNEGNGLSSDIIATSMKVRTDILNQELWRRDLQRSESCATYRRFKKDVKVEPYLCGALSKKCTRAIARFRCRSNFLPASSFERYADPEFRPTCGFCWSQRADEVHYLCRCPFFSGARNRLLGSAMIEEQRFEPLMAEQDMQVFRNTARLIYEIVDTFDIIFST